ncbi:hypothetical protein F5878DRAFT_449778 [Lentinula raphanica]|uniref:C3H1-type domain-containing protein n=1 Tax=Lentinula raphanica TaxID=153919 RepID=A0AA38NXU9_9AGAR|nr:hypothetical protein F5878DRAFT_449778 [Lentinula raphanica]
MSRHSILVLSLYEEDYMYATFEHLMSSMRAVATVKLVTSAKEAKSILLSDTPPTAVLSIDAAPTDAKYVALNYQLVRFAKAGGTVVFGCNFSNHFAFGSDGPFFRAWGLTWNLGEYHRTTVYLNKNGVPGMALAGLEPSYSVKALNLAKVPTNLAVYSPSSSSRTQSHVFPPTSVDTSQAPFAYTAIGAGFMGYAGDVNAEAPTTKVIMAMLHLSVDQVGPDRRNRNPPSRPMFGPGWFNGGTDTSSVQYIPEPVRVIPSRVTPTTPRPREAEVEARAARRKIVDQRKREAADEVKEKGNDLFKVGNYDEAVKLYKQASKIYKPLPAYMLNLAAAYIKLERWSEAEIAADDAILVDPTLLKAYFRRARARKCDGKYVGAIRDIKQCLKMSPNCADFKTELAATRRERDAKNGFDGDKYEAEDEKNEDSEDRRYKASLMFGLGREFIPESTLHVLDCPSDSEDYEHQGRKDRQVKSPCRNYNHEGCQLGKGCRYKHAPDGRSVRDELGRNVCLHFLINRCKSGDECSYAHEKLYLPSNGWWNDENLGGWQELYDFVNQELADGGFDRIGSAMNGTADIWRIRTNLDLLVKDWTRATEGSLYQSPDEHNNDEEDDDDDDDNNDSEDGEDWSHEKEMEERERNMGFSDLELNELLSHGLKPWDDDAWDVLHAIRNDHA